MATHLPSKCSGGSQIPRYPVFTMVKPTLQRHRATDVSHRITAGLSSQGGVHSGDVARPAKARRDLETLGEPGASRSPWRTRLSFHLTGSFLLRTSWFLHNAPGAVQRAPQQPRASISCLPSAPSRYRSKFQFSTQGLSPQTHNSISHPCSLSQSFGRHAAFLCQVCGRA